MAQPRRRKFEALFQAKLKPAIEKWCKAFGERAPFSPDDVTSTNFGGRVGERSHEYLFMVNGITFGVGDRGGVINMDYLNVGAETRKLMTIPTNGAPPITTTPITREEAAEILNRVSARPVALHEIRITPSGLSGSMNGGAFVRVGGDPENIGSWRFNIVIGPDGKLGYYLEGADEIAARKRPAN